MENKLLQRQQIEALIYYANERKNFRKVRTNIFLVATILALCVSIRLANKNGFSGINESTKQKFFDFPSRQVISKFNHSQVA
jgi:ribosomal protein S24E